MILIKELIRTSGKAKRQQLLSFNKVFTIEDQLKNCLRPYVFSALGVPPEVMNDQK